MKQRVLPVSVRCCFVYFFQPYSGLFNGRGWPCIVKCMELRLATVLTVKEMTLEKRKHGADEQYYDRGLSVVVVVFGFPPVVDVVLQVRLWTNSQRD